MESQRHSCVLRDDNSPKGMVLERRLLEEVPLPDKQAALTRYIPQPSMLED